MTPPAQLNPKETRAEIHEALIERFDLFKARYDIVNLLAFVTGLSPRPSWI